MHKYTIFLVAVTVIFWGIAPIFDKLALKQSTPFLGTLLRGIGVGIFMAIIAVVSGNIKNVLSLPVKSILFFIASGLLAGGLGVFTFYKALQFDTTSRIVPLVATYPLVTALLSILFFAEQVTVVRVLGIVLIIAGIILVK